MLPVDNSFLDPSLANNLPVAGYAAKVSSILTADGWSKSGGKWTKNGKTISFTISDPVPYSDYYTDDQLIARQLNALGFNVKVDGIGNPTVWAGDVANGTFDATHPLVQPGPEPVRVPRRVDGQHAERPDRQAGRRRLRPVQQPGRAGGDQPVLQLPQRQPSRRRRSPSWSRS